VTCTVKTAYYCDVPIGKFLICGGGSMQIEEHMSLPMQGARYR
jgi:hypothetical protein